MGSTISVAKVYFFPEIFRDILQNFSVKRLIAASLVCALTACSVTQDKNKRVGDTDQQLEAISILEERLANLKPQKSRIKTSGIVPLIPSAGSGNDFEIADCNRSDGSQRGFNLFELQISTINVENTDIERVIASLKTFGLTTLSARDVTSADAFADIMENSDDETGFLGEPDPDEVDEPEFSSSEPAPEAGKSYTCAELPVFFHSPIKPVDNLPSTIQTSAERDGSKFSLVNLRESDFGSNKNILVFNHPSQKKQTAANRERVESIPR